MSCLEQGRVARECRRAPEGWTWRRIGGTSVWGASRRYQEHGTRGCRHLVQIWQRLAQAREHGHLYTQSVWTGAFPPETNRECSCMITATSLAIAGPRTSNEHQINLTL